jgi:hypothetical protein
MPAEPVDLLPQVPVSRYDIDCAQLVPAALVAETIGSGLSVATGARHDWVRPSQVLVRHVGGLDCSWDNGEPEWLDEGHMNPAYKAVHVQVLPDPDNLYQRYAPDSFPQDPADAAFGDGSSTACVGGTDLCFVNASVNGSWVELMINGLGLTPEGTDADARDKADPLISTVFDQIPEPSPGLTIPAPVDCARALPVDAVLTGFGVPEGAATYDAGAGGGPDDLTSAAIQYTGNALCLAGESESDSPYAAAWVLPGGAWAFRDGDVPPGLRSAAEPISIPGTSAPESFLACDGSRCTVDFAVGPDWVQVEIVTREATDSEQDPADAVTLATHVLDNLTHTL